MGSLLTAPVTTKVIERYNADDFVASMVAVNGYRTSMEDSSYMTFRKGWAYGGVFDGHAGGDCSIFVSTAILKHLDYLSDHNIDIANGDLSNEMIDRLCFLVDQEYLAAKGPSGTTATFFIAHSYTNDICQLIIVNIGDSRTMLFRDNGAVFETVDHKPDDINEYKRIEEAGGFVTDGRVNGQLAVSRAFGDLTYKRINSTNQEHYLDSSVSVKPDITHIPFQRNNVLVCCCDGMFESDVWSTREIGMNVMSNIQTEDPGYLITKLAQMAIDRGSKDNVSLLLFRYKFTHEQPEPYKREIIVGPFLAPNFDQYRNAYEKMAALGGMTLIEALCNRLQVVSANRDKLENTIDNTSDIKKMGEEIKILQDIIANTSAVY